MKDRHGTGKKVAERKKNILSVVTLCVVLSLTFTWKHLQLGSLSKESIPTFYPYGPRLCIQCVCILLLAIYNLYVPSSVNLCGTYIQFICTSLTLRRMLFAYALRPLIELLREESHIYALVRDRLIVSYHFQQAVRL
jgi:hypothetical protein